MGVGAAWESQIVCNRFLEMYKGIHIRPCSSKHVITPEHHLHQETPVPDEALHQLETGAVIELLIDIRIPGHCNSPPADW